MQDNYSRIETRKLINKTKIHGNSRVLPINQKRTMEALRKLVKF